MNTSPSFEKACVDDRVFICRACGFTPAINTDNLKQKVRSYVSTMPHGFFEVCPLCKTENVASQVNYTLLYASRDDSSNYPSSNELLVRLKSLVLKYSARRLLNRFSHDATILDFGCGGGEFANAIHAVGFQRVSATDVQTDRPASLASQITYCSSMDLNPMVTFDVIVLRHVLEHLEHPLETLKTLKDLLKPEGLLFVEIPNGKSVFKRLLKSQWPGYFYPYHTLVLSDSGAQLLFERARLQLMEKMSTEPPILGALYMGWGLGRTWARILSLISYPLQVLVSKFAFSSEGVLFVLRK